MASMRQGTVVARRQLRRRQVLSFFEKLPSCLVGMEACATAHHWGWEIERLGHRVRLQDAAWFFEDHVVIEDEGGAVTVEREAGKRAAAAFEDVKAAIHRHHGLLTASRHSIDSAAFWFIALERRCQQQLMVEASGVRPVLVPPERARYSRKHVGSDYIGWLHFQPIYDRLVQTSPDMFD
jgi:ribulose-5-phosphate 4-epimerase/fuculose-1-phosphate aldolase